MRLKLVKYSIGELIIDYKQVSRNLNALCHSKPVFWQVSGLCIFDDTAIITLDQVECPPECDYFFAPVKTDSLADLEADIQSHWQSGALTLGLVPLNESEYLALYSREK